MADNFGENSEMNMKLRNQIASRLKTLMDNTPSLSTQSKLEKKSGVAQATIGRILRSETDTRVDTLLAIAEAFGKPLSYFLEVTGNVDKAPDFSPARKAPLISWIQAGSWHEASDPLQPGDGEDWYDVPAGTSESAFWLRVVGDSMTSPAGLSVPEGSFILVEPGLSPDNGRLVVAKLTDTNEVTFKKLIIDGGRKFLKPLNPAYPMLEINSNCHIVGVVTESKQRL